MEILSSQKYGFCISSDGKSIYKGNSNPIQENILENK